MSLRYEAWTTPWDPAGFHRKVSMMPVVEGTGRGSVGFLSLGNDGAADISLANFDRLVDLVSETDSSLITVFDCQADGTNTIIDEWILDRVPQRLAEDREVSLAGPSLLKQALDGALVYAFDYPKSPSVTRDHIWGKALDDDDTGLIQNGTFEDVPLPNGGFEDGNAGHWQGTEDDGDIIGNGAISAVSSATDARTGSWYGSVNPLAQGGGARRSIAGLVPGENYTITGWINESSGSGDRLRAGIIGASTATHTNAYEESETWWAEIGNASQGNGASTGAWQAVTLTFKPETDHVELVVIYDDINDRTFRIDDFAISGDNVGLEPWIPYVSNRANGAVLNVARHSTAQAHGGAGSVQLQGVDGPFHDAFGRIGYGNIGIRQDVRMVPGRLYTFTAWVRHNGAGANGANEIFSIVLARKTPKGDVQKTLTGDFIPGPGSYHMAADRVSIPSNTWTKIQITVYADVSELSASIRYKGTNLKTDVGTFNSPTFWVDDVSIHEGLPATTIGDIWQRLLDDCTLSHANDTRGTVLEWIDYSSFDAVNDSNGVPWNEDIPFLARWGSTMGHVLDDTYNRGYEAELVRKAVPSGGKTHDFHLYNTGGRDDAPTVGINTAQPNLGGETLYRTPAYTAALVASPDGAYTEDSDATAITNFGRLETFLLDSEASGPVSRQLLADNLLAYEQANRKAVRFELIEAPGIPRPFVDYRPGDTISMTQPPGLAKEQRRVQRIDYVNLHPTQYVVVGSRVVEGEAAAFDLLERLWRRLNRPGEYNDPELGVGGEGVKGGAPTVVVAASNATDLSKSKADFVCNGVDDHVVIQQAIDIATWALGSGGRVLLTEGEFVVNPPSGGAAITLSSCTLEGMGRWSTFISDLSTSDPGSSAIIQVQNATPIRNLNIYANWSGVRAIQGQSGWVVSELTMENVYIETQGGAGVQADAGNLWYISNCHILSRDGRFESNIVAENLTDAFITNNWIIGGKHNIEVVQSSGIGETPHNIHITDNYLWSPGESFIWFDGASINQFPFSFIAHNFCHAGGREFVTYSDTGGIHIIGDVSDTGEDISVPSTIGEPSILVLDNVIEATALQDAIRVIRAHGCAIRGNYGDSIEGHGVALIDTQGAEVSGNRWFWPDDDDTYDAFHLAGDSSFNFIHHNYVVNDVTDFGGGPAVDGGRYRYGINISAVTCVDNIVVGNALGPVGNYGTDALNDAGTDTQLIYPNDATYGDNFTL